MEETDHQGDSFLPLLLGLKDYPLLLDLLEKHHHHHPEEMFLLLQHHRETMIELGTNLRLRGLNPNLQ